MDHQILPSKQQRNIVEKVNFEIRRFFSQKEKQTWNSQQTPTTRKSFVKRSKLTLHKNVLENAKKNNRKKRKYGNINKRNKEKQNLEVLHVSVVNQLFANLACGRGVEVNIDQNEKEHLDCKLHPDVGMSVLIQYRHPNIRM